MHISVEGGIGVGKSTVLDGLRKVCGKHVAFVAEPVDDWERHGFLQAMYTGDASFTEFQHVCTASCFARECAAFGAGAEIVVQERGMDAAMNVFSELGSMSRVSREMLWFSYTQLCATRPQVERRIVYLQLHPAEAMERIRVRGRECEAGVGLDYIQSLTDVYDGWIKSMVAAGTSVVTVDASRPAEEVLATVLSVLRAWDC